MGLAGSSGLIDAAAVEDIVAEGHKFVSGVGTRVCDLSNARDTGYAAPLSPEIADYDLAADIRLLHS